MEYLDRMGVQEWRKLIFGSREIFEDSDGDENSSRMKKKKKVSL